MTGKRRSSLDETDLKILRILQEDARISKAEVGRRVGLVGSAVFARLDQLEEEKVLTAYESRIDPDAVGLSFTAFAFVRVVEPAGGCETALRLAEMEEVQEVHHVAGEDCYLLKVRVRDARDFGEFLREKVGPLDAVTSTRTTVVLETLKETCRLPLPAAAP